MTERRAASPAAIAPIVLVLGFAHLLDDMNQGAVPALLPFLVEQRHLSYAAAAGLVFAGNSASSLVQPAIGHLADRVRMPWVAPTGLALAGAGVALSCAAKSYAGVFLCILMSGIGVAMFHPEAARMVRDGSGTRRATAMSLFSIGGNLGFATGPLVTTPLVAAFGLRAGLWLLAPPLLMALALARLTRRLSRVAPDASPGGPAGARDDWGSFGLLSVVIIVRSVVFFGLNTFLPLYWASRFGASKQAASNALSLMLLCSAAGTLVGGHLADRLGRRAIALAAIALLVVPVLLLTSAGSPALALAMLVPIGLLISAPYSALVVMGQDFLPNHIGLASGVTLGLAVTAGGMATPLLGLFADHQGLGLTLRMLGVLPLIALLALARLRAEPPPARA